MLRPHPPILLRLLTVLGVAGCGESRQPVGSVRPGEEPAATERGPQKGNSSATATVSGGTDAPSITDAPSFAPQMDRTTLATAPTAEPETPAPVPQPDVYWVTELTAPQAQANCPELENTTWRRAYEVCFVPGETATAPDVSDVCAPEQAEYTVEATKHCGLGFVARLTCGQREPEASSLGAPTAGELSGGAVQGPDAGQGSVFTSRTHGDGGADAGYVDDPSSSSSWTGAEAVTACCTTVAGVCPVGRPFIVDGASRRADVHLASQADWTSVFPASDVGLAPEQRRLVGECWLQDARSEHASAGAFARFTLQCLALGTPVELVLASQQAIRDEIEHARLSFGLAQRYLGHVHEPGPLDIRGALEETTLLAVTLSTVSEGCIAETVSAVLLTAARDAAREPEVKSTLSRLVEEELAHAELAWKFLAWALSQSPELTPRVREVFERAASHVGFGELHHPGPDAAGLRAHGCLPTSELRELTRGALRDIVAPAAAALLG